VVARAARRLEVLTHRLRLWDSDGRYVVVERLGTGETEVIRCEDGLIVEAEMGTLRAYERALVGALRREGEAQEPTTRVAGGPRRARKGPVVAVNPAVRERLLKATMTLLVGSSIKDGTKSTYDSAFRHWVLFRTA